MWNQLTNPQSDKFEETIKLVFENIHDFTETHKEVVLRKGYARLLKKKKSKSSSNEDEPHSEIVFQKMTWILTT